MYDSDDEKSGRECDFKRRRHQDWVNTRRQEHKRMFELNRKRILGDGANHGQPQQGAERPLEGEGELEGQREELTQREWAEKQRKEEKLEYHPSLETVLPLLQNEWLARPRPFPIIIDSSYQDLIEQYSSAKSRCQREPLNYIDVHGLLAAVASETDVREMHRGVIFLRRLTTGDYLREIAIQIVDNDLVEVLLRMAQQCEFRQLKMEATWVLTNIASGKHDHCELMVEKGIVPILMSIMNENEEFIVDQAIWAIGNIAADCFEYAKMVQESGALELLLRLAKSERRYHMFVNECWAITTIIRAISKEHYHIYREALMLLCQALRSNFIQGQQIGQTLKTVVDKFSEPAGMFEEVYTSGIVPYSVRLGLKLIPQFKHLQFSEDKQPLVETLQYVFDLLGDMFRSDHNCTQFAMDCEALDLIERVLFTPCLQSSQLVREALWMVANVSAGKHSQVDTVLRSANILEAVDRYLEEGLWGERKEAIYVYCNMLYLGNPKNVAPVILSVPLVKSIMDLVTSSDDSSILIPQLGCLSVLLSHGASEAYKRQDKTSFREDFLSDSENMVRLTELQRHESDKVYSLATHIIEEYFQEYMEDHQEILG